MLALAAKGRNHNRFRTVTPGETFLDGMGKGRMRTELQPNVDTKISNRVNRRCKLDRLTHAASPMLRTACFTGEAIASHRAKEWDGFGLRRKIDKRVLKRFRRRLHHGVMKRVIDAHHSREH